VSDSSTSKGKKQAKGYVFVAEVAIDHEGNVAFPGQNHKHGEQPSEAMKTVKQKLLIQGRW